MSNPKKKSIESTPHHIWAEWSTPDFVSTIYRGTAEFPMAPKVVNARTPSDHAAYVRKLEMNNVKLYSRSIHEISQNVRDFVDFYNQVRPVFADLFTDYDREIVLPTTAALGFVPPVHTDLDRLGSLGVRNSYLLRDDTYDLVVAYYKRHLPRGKGDLKLTLPVGTFLGYPFMVSGSQREVSSYLLSVMVSIGIGYRIRNSDVGSLKGIYSFLRSYHGDPFSSYGYRGSHSGSEQPLRCLEGMYSTVNAVMRNRIINLETKISVAEDRLDVKTLLSMLLSTPVHCQNRLVILAIVKFAKSLGFKVFGGDKAKFDMNTGGKRLDQQLRLHSAIIDSPSYYANASAAAQTRFWVPSNGRVYEFPGDIMLKSGLGNTTIVGCTTNFAYSLEAVAHALGVSVSEALEQMIVRNVDSENNTFTPNPSGSWGMLCWGDDGLFFFKDSDTFEKFMAYSNDVQQYPTEAEPAGKYLGSIYDAGPFSGTVPSGYSPGSIFQHMFFPERKKLYPFNLVSYLAQLELLGPAGEAFHDRARSIWHLMERGEYFLYKDRHSKLAELQPLILKNAAKGAVLADVMNIFTHGLGAEGGGIPESFQELLPFARPADLSDPLAFLEKDAKNFDYRLDAVAVRLVRSLCSGDLYSYPTLLRDFVARTGLHWSPGSVVY